MAICGGQVPEFTLSCGAVRATHIHRSFVVKPKTSSLRPQHRISSRKQVAQFLSQDETVETANEYIVLRRRRNRRRLTPPRVAAPAVMTGQENDPRSSSSVEKRRARARAQALATQGSPLTAVAQRWKRWRTRGSMPAAPPAASRPKSSLGDGQLLYGLLEAACETPFLRRRPTRDAASSARGLRRSRR